MLYSNNKELQEKIENHHDYCFRKSFAYNEVSNFNGMKLVKCDLVSSYLFRMQLENAKLSGSLLGNISLGNNVFVANLTGAYISIIGAISDVDISIKLHEYLRKFIWINF